MYRDLAAHFEQVNVLYLAGNHGRRTPNEYRQIAGPQVLPGNGSWGPMALMAGSLAASCLETERPTVEENLQHEAFNLQAASLTAALTPVDLTQLPSTQLGSA
ncbi:MAG: hypothetical protein ABFC88_02455 [Thermoguttaceae bacterium]